MWFIKMLLDINNIIKPTEVNSEWKLPKLSQDIRPKCLTDLLEDIPEFQRALLPNSRFTVTQINRILKTRPFIKASDYTIKNSLYSSVALAVDRGALLLFGQDIIKKPIKFLNTFGNYEHHLANIIEKFAPLARDIIYNEETAGWLYLLGRLEPVMRGFRPISDVKIKKLPTRFTSKSISYWLSSIISKSAANEISSLIKIIEKLQLPGEIFPNPIFGGIGPIFGSDGDWISGETLVELKCTVRGMKREYIAQIICYAALSKIGTQSKKIPMIKQLAICLPRQSSMIVGSIDDWLRAFGAPSSSIVFKSIENYFSSYNYW